MPRTARRYDIYLPLAFNDGRPIPSAAFAAVEDRLLDRFEGLTTQEQDRPLRGIWKTKRRLFFDQVVVYSTIDYRPNGSSRFVVRMKKNLLREFDQLEILITETMLLVY